jgi:hypothetical protein
MVENKGLQGSGGYSTVVICRVGPYMLPLVEAKYANQDKGVWHGIADCGSGAGS